MTDEPGRPTRFEEPGAADTTAPVPGFDEPAGSSQEGTVPSFEEPDPAPEAEIPSSDEVTNARVATRVGPRETT